MAYNKASVLISRYNKTKSKEKFFLSRDKIDATNKWVEYSLDLHELKALVQVSDFETRFDLEKAIKTVEAKVEWMYKHENFNMSEATTLYRRAKKLLNYK